MDPLVTSALVGAGSSSANGLFGQIFAGVNARRDYNYFKKKMDYQDKIQDENIANERAYNSPAAVSARMRAAGLAPQNANNVNAGLSSASPGVSADGAGSGPIPQLDMSALISRLAHKVTTPVDDAVIQNQEAQAESHAEEARSKKIDNDIKENNQDAYTSSKLEDWASRKILNNLSSKQIEALDNLMQFRDDESARGWFREESNRKTAEAALKQAAASLVNAKVNYSESEYRKANMLKDIDVKNSTITLQGAYAAESTQRQKNLLEEINNLIAQRNLTEQQIKQIKNIIALNWATFGTNTALNISKEAHSWLTLGLADGGQPLEYIREDVPILFGPDNTPVVKKVSKK